MRLSGHSLSVERCTAVDHYMLEEGSAPGEDNRQAAEHIPDPEEDIPDLVEGSLGLVEGSLLVVVDHIQK